MNLPSAMDDFIISTDACTRYEQVLGSVSSFSGTTSLKLSYEAFFNTGLFDRISAATGIANDPSTMYQVVDYIDWATKNQQNLVIDVT